MAKLLNLEVLNFKKIKRQEIEFSGKSLIFKAGNGKGKTTLINAILIALGLKSIPTDPVTTGEVKGEIILPFEYQGKNYKSVVKLSKSDSGGSLTLIDMETNQPMKAPKTVLETMFGKIIEPFEIVRKQKTKPGRRENEEMILPLAKLDLAEIDNKITELENDRLLTGQQVTRFGSIPFVEKVEKVDTTVLINKRKDIESANKKLLDDYNLLVSENRRDTEAANTKLRNAYDTDCDNEIKDIEAFNKIQRDRQAEIDKYNNALIEVTSFKTTCEKQIEELEAKLLEAKEALQTYNARIEKGNKIIAELPKAEGIKPLVSVIKAPEYNDVEKILASITQPEYAMFDEIDLQIQTAGETNEKALNYTNYLTRVQQKSELENKYADLDQQVNGKRTERSRMIQQAVFPVDGMSLGDDGLTIHGLAFDEENISAAEIISIGWQLHIAINGIDKHLPVIYIPNASLLDDKHTAEIEALAIKNNAFAIYEIVSKDQEVAVEIYEPGNN